MDDTEANDAQEATETADQADAAAEDGQIQAADDQAEPGDDGPSGPADDDAVYDVPVEISAVLGTAQIQVSQLLKMGRGAVLELDRKVGDPVDILVNKRMVARGEVVVVEDRLGVTLTDTMHDE